MSADIVYLFGAGATLAEEDHPAYGPKPKTRNLDECVLTRICQNPKDKELFQRCVNKNYEYSDISGKIESIKITSLEPPKQDIELLISFLELAGAHSDAQIIRQYYARALIDCLIYDDTFLVPLLYSAILDFHKQHPERENLLGCITTNYDWLLDCAFQDVYRGVNYGSWRFANHASNPTIPPLLKLHGSYNWIRDPKSMRVISKEGVKQELADFNKFHPVWLAPGASKNYWTPPFGDIYSAAERILSNCDTLRIVGSSLSHYDLSLIHLLFKTQNAHDYDIQFIAGSTRYEKTLRRLGFYLDFDENYLTLPNYHLIHKETHGGAFLDWLDFFFKSMNVSTNYSQKISAWWENGIG
ncbi:SIR2-like domain protein [Candidatus Norongarragalina meridionalis]|nr:SIR2-like domain protein [Candidatus Norongarragalina meridionalis]